MRPHLVYPVLLLLLVLNIIEVFLVFYTIDRARTTLRSGRKTNSSRTMRTGRARRREDGTDILSDFEEMEKQRLLKESKEELENQGDVW
jgi:hypothetical protein